MRFPKYPISASSPYGKETVREGRKMAHITELHPLGSDVPEDETSLI